MEYVYALFEQLLFSFFVHIIVIAQRLHTIISTYEQMLTFPCIYTMITSFD